MSSNGDSNDPKKRDWSAWRWRAAAALVIAAVAIVLYSRLSGDLQVCHEVVADKAQGSKVEICEPLGLLELAPVLLLLLVLMWPEIGELEIAGLATIKTRIAETEARAAELDERITQIQSTVAVDSSNATTVVVDVGALARDLPRKADEFRPTEQSLQVRGVAPIGESDVAEAQLSHETADSELRVRLLHIWDVELWPWVELARYLQGRKWRGLIANYVEGRPPERPNDLEVLDRVVPPGLRSGDLEIVRAWYEQFYREIEAVRGGRNAVAHPRAAPDVSSQTLSELVTIADRTTGVLRSQLSHEATDE